MKHLVIADLSKRCNDTNNRLKEFSALYDVVKNERNKYVNLIQASHQALAEMKEKIKILHNEVPANASWLLAADNTAHVDVGTEKSMRLSRGRQGSSWRQWDLNGVRVA